MTPTPSSRLADERELTHADRFIRNHAECHTDTCAAPGRTLIENLAAIARRAMERADGGQTALNYATKEWVEMRQQLEERADKAEADKRIILRQRDVHFERAERAEAELAEGLQREAVWQANYSEAIKERDAARSELKAVQMHGETHVFSLKLADAEADLKEARAEAEEAKAHVVSLTYLLRDAKAEADALRGAVLRCHMGRYHRPLVDCPEPLLRALSGAGTAKAERAGGSEQTGAKSNGAPAAARPADCRYAYLPKNCPIKHFHFVANACGKCGWVGPESDYHDEEYDRCRGKPAPAPRECPGMGIGTTHDGLFFATKAQGLHCPACPSRKGVP